MKDLETTLWPPHPSPLSASASTHICSAWQDIFAAELETQHKVSRHWQVVDLHTCEFFFSLLFRIAGTQTTRTTPSAHRQLQSSSFESIPVKKFSYKTFNFAVTLSQLFLVVIPFVCLFLYVCTFVCLLAWLLFVFFVCFNYSFLLSFKTPL